MLLSHVGLCDLQGLLGGAMGGQFAAEADDAGGLAGAALLELVDKLAVTLGARRMGLALLVGAPQQQAEGAEQGGAVEGLAQGCHLRYQPAAFMAASSRACRSPRTRMKR